MRINYFTIVWGFEYIEKFIKYTIPSLLSPKNVSCMIGQKYYIYTDASFKEHTLVTSENFRRLEEICKIIFVNAPGADRDSRLICSTKNAIETAFKDQAILKIIPPETVYSDGSFPNMLKKLSEGYDAVIFPFGGLRVEEKSYMSDGDVSLKDKFFKHMHKETRAHYTNSDTFIPGPVMYIDEDNIIKSFYHQPSFMRVNKLSDFENLELDFVNSLVEKDKVYVVKNSDEAFEVSLTPNKYCGYASKKFDEKEFLEYNSNHINPVSSLSYESGYAIV